MIGPNWPSPIAEPHPHATISIRALRESASRKKIKEILDGIVAVFDLGNTIIANPNAPNSYGDKLLSQLPSIAGDGEN